MLSTQTFINKNSFDEGFPSNNPGLARASHVNVIQDIWIQLSTLRSEDQNVLFWFCFYLKRHAEQQ